MKTEYEDGLRIVYQNKCSVRDDTAFLWGGVQYPILFRNYVRSTAEKG